MKNKKLFFDALNTLLHAWGSDTPAEATWAANEMIDWLEAEYNVKSKYRFSETSEYGGPGYIEDSVVITHLMGLI